VIGFDQSPHFAQIAVLVFELVIENPGWLLFEEASASKRLFLFSGARHTSIRPTNSLSECCHAPVVFNR
jgi:hypothetical protein